MTLDGRRRVTPLVQSAFRERNGPDGRRFLLIKRVDAAQTGTPARLVVVLTGPKS